MRRFFIDWKLILPALIILIIGLAAIFSSAPAIGLEQLIFTVISLVAFLITANFSYSSHQHLVKIYLIGSIILLILPFVFGTLTRGTIRWIQIGSLTLQPSEIIKPFLIIIFSYYLSQAKITSKLKTISSYFSLLLVPAFLIFKQPDLGSTLVIIAIWLGILVASKLPFYGLTAIVFLSLFFTPLAWNYLKPYQQQRIASFINPYADPKASGYHSIQSIIAVGSGGLFGRGLGHGPQSQLQFLPERHTDFIFASLAEEGGLLGSLTLIIAFFFLLARLLIISQRAPDSFGQLIGIGIFTLIFFQFTVNIGMNLGLLPITGITLPLVSSGGSSLLAIAICLGLAHNLSRHANIKNSVFLSEIYGS
ncbi:MAG: rod shape-determining protein RodA [Candidatus Beckwithbacteria bacterium]